MWWISPNAQHRPMACHSLYFQVKHFLDTKRNCFTIAVENSLLKWPHAPPVSFWGGIFEVHSFQINLYKGNICGRDPILQMVAVANGYWDWESNLQKFTLLCLFSPKSSLVFPLETRASPCGAVGGFKPPTAALSYYNMDISFYSGIQQNLIQRMYVCR